MKTPFIVFDSNLMVKPHQRPRFGKGRTYQPKQKELIESLRKQNSLKKPIDKPIGLVVSFYYVDKRTRDIDNLLKALFDGLQDVGIIKNDSQIMNVHAYKELKSSFNGYYVSIREV